MVNAPAMPTAPNKWRYHKARVLATWGVGVVGALTAFYYAFEGFARQLLGASAQTVPGALRAVSVVLILVVLTAFFAKRWRREAVVLLLPLSGIVWALPGLPIYTPVTLVRWLARALFGAEPYFSYFKQLTAEPASAILAVSAVLAWTFAVWSFCFRAPKTDEHDSARWATEDELRRESLLDQHHGLVIGRLRNLNYGEKWRLAALRVLALAERFEVRAWEAAEETSTVIDWLDPQTLPALLEPPTATAGDRRRLALGQVTVALLGLDATRSVALAGNRGQALTRSNALAIRDDSETHYLAYAPAGTGKTTALAVPALLGPKEQSVVVLDRTGTLYGLTAGYRQRVLGHNVYQVNPTSLRSHSYNPCQSIIDAQGTLFEERELQRVAYLLINPHGQGGNSAPTESAGRHFADTAQDAIAAVLLHLAYVHPEHCNFAGVLKYLTQATMSFEEKLKHMMAYPHGKHVSRTWDSPSGGQTDVHPGVSSRCRNALDKTGRELKSLHSTITRHLQAWRDPLLAAATHKCEWTPGQLLNGDRPSTVYLGIPPGDQDRTETTIRLILGSILDELTGHLEIEDGRAVSAHRWPILFLLDEFPTLGRWPKFNKALGVIRGYGGRAMFLVQGLNQIKEFYGASDQIRPACGVTVTFKPNDIETAEYVSKTLGKMTLHAHRESGRGDHTDLLMETRQISESVHARPLLTPSEFDRMQEEDLVAKAHGLRIYAQQLRYYKDPLLLAASKIPPPEVPLADHEGAARPVPPDEHTPEKPKRPEPTKEATAQRALETLARLLPEAVRAAGADGAESDVAAEVVLGQELGGGELGLDVEDSDLELGADEI